MIEKVILPEADFLQSLNEQQKEAVNTFDGPLLVLSGAGTGKTKVLTSRIANLIFSRILKINLMRQVFFLSALGVIRSTKGIRNFNIFD